MSAPIPFRPTTRGELRDCLADGISCEVVAYCAEMTAIMLRGWLKFDAFTMRPADTAGWILFEPKPAASAALPKGTT